MTDLECAREIMALAKHSTKVGAWYPHPGGDCYGERATVRGPFFRWFEIREVDDQYKQHVATAEDDAKFAAAAMNSAVDLANAVIQKTSRIEELEAALKTIVESAEFFKDRFEDGSQSFPWAIARQALSSKEKE